VATNASARHAGRTYDVLIGDIGDLLCRLGEALVNAARGSNVPRAGHRAPTAKNFVPPERCYLDTTAGDIRNAGARKMHLAVSFFSNSV
jgi:hypothetical protein